MSNGATVPIVSLFCVSTFFTIVMLNFFLNLSVFCLHLVCLSNFYCLKMVTLLVAILLFFVVSSSHFSSEARKMDSETPNPEFKFNGSKNQC